MNDRLWSTDALEIGERRRRYTPSSQANAKLGRKARWRMVLSASSSGGELCDRLWMVAEVEPGLGQRILVLD